MNCSILFKISQADQTNKTHQYGVTPVMSWMESLRDRRPPIALTVLP